MTMDLRSAIAKILPQPAAYIVASLSGDYLYKGGSRNLQERLKDHLAGRESRIKNRRPLALVCFEHFASYSGALKQERFLKSGQGRRWLQTLLRAHVQ